MKSSKFLVFGGLLISFASCSPKFYTPNTQNVPLISGKGMGTVTAAGNANQVEFQGAYGVTDKIAIQANGGLFIPSDLDNGNGGSGRFLEVGGGYFKAIDPNWVFETYALLGIGRFENHLPSTVSSNPQTTGDLSGNLLRVGIQPNFGYKSKYFSAAISSRFVHLGYSNVKGDLIFDNQVQAAYLSQNSSQFLMEPALTVRGGLEKIKLQLQVGFSVNLTTSNFRQDYSNATLGLHFNF